MTGSEATSIGSSVASDRGAHRNGAVGDRVGAQWAVRRQLSRHVVERVDGEGGA
jgi:hypothetical protein